MSNQDTIKIGTTKYKIPTAVCTYIEWLHHAENSKKQTIKDLKQSLVDDYIVYSSRIEQLEDKIKLQKAYILELQKR